MTRPGAKKRDPTKRWPDSDWLGQPVPFLTYSVFTVSHKLHNGCETKFCDYTNSILHCLHVSSLSEPMRWHFGQNCITTKYSVSIAAWVQPTSLKKQGDTKFAEKIKLPFLSVFVALHGLPLISLKNFVARNAPSIVLYSPARNLGMQLTLPTQLYFLIFWSSLSLTVSFQNALKHALKRIKLLRMKWLKLFYGTDPIDRRD